MPLEKCPEALPPELLALIEKFARGWADSLDRPKLYEKICADGDRLLDDWISEKSLPLFVRKSINLRGQAIKHKSGRTIVPTDNSPAQWAFARAMSSEPCPSLEDLRKWLIPPLSVPEEIPIAFALSKIQLAAASYKKTLSRGAGSVNSAGWKLAHICSIGLNKKGGLESLDIDDIGRHHRKFLSLRNMFLVPLQWAGLAELSEVVGAMR